MRLLTDKTKTQKPEAATCFFQKSTSAESESGLSMVFMRMDRAQPKLRMLTQPS